MPAKRNHPPDWFKLADYAEANKFNLFDWVPMLSHRYLWNETLSFNQPMSNEQKAVYWEVYLKDVLPCNIHANRSAPTLLGPGWDREAVLASSRIIHDITDECSKGLDKILQGPQFEMEVLRGLKFEMEIGTRVLAVNTSAPDTVLKKRFHDWLKKRRKQSPLPAKRRGRPAPNVEITSDHLRGWVQYNVLAVFDLDFYAQVFGIKPISHEQLGKLLECHRDVNAKNWGRDARNKGKEAMQCLNVLVAQTQGEGEPK